MNQGHPKVRPVRGPCLQWRRVRSVCACGVISILSQHQSFLILRSVARREGDTISWKLHHAPCSSRISLRSDTYDVM